MGFTVTFLYMHTMYFNPIYSSSFPLTPSDPFSQLAPQFYFLAFIYDSRFLGHLTYTVEENISPPGINNV